MNDSDVIFENYRSSILLEYTEKVIKQLITRFQREDPNLSEEDARAYIERFSELQQSPYLKDHAEDFNIRNHKDIFQYPWQALKEIVERYPGWDRLPQDVEPMEGTSEEDLIYDQNNLEVWKGFTKSKCIDLADKISERSGYHRYTFCISAPNNTNFRFYRNNQGNRIFYFVYDKDKPTTDPNHVLVIHVFTNGTYGYTPANNPGDILGKTWDDLVQLQPKLEGLQELFQPQPLRQWEINDLDFNRIDDEAFLNLPFRNQLEGIQGGFKFEAYDAFKKLHKVLKQEYLNRIGSRCFINFFKMGYYTSISDIISELNKFRVDDNTNYKRLVKLFTTNRNEDLVDSYAKPIDGEGLIFVGAGLGFEKGAVIDKLGEQNIINPRAIKRLLPDRDTAISNDLKAYAAVSLPKVSLVRIDISGNNQYFIFYRIGDHKYIKTEVTVSLLESLVNDDVTLEDEKLQRFVEAIRGNLSVTTEQLCIELLANGTFNDEEKARIREIGGGAIGAEQFKTVLSSSGKKISDLWTDKFVKLKKKKKQKYIPEILKDISKEVRDYIVENIGEDLLQEEIPVIYNNFKEAIQADVNRYFEEEDAHRSSQSIRGIHTSDEKTIYKYGPVAFEINSDLSVGDTQYFVLRYKTSDIYNTDNYTILLYDFSNEKILAKQEANSELEDVTDDPVGLFKLFLGEEADEFFNAMGDEIDGFNQFETVISIFDDWSVSSMMGWDDISKVITNLLWVYSFQPIIERYIPSFNQQLKIGKSVIIERGQHYFKVDVENMNPGMIKQYVSHVSDKIGEQFRKILARYTIDPKELYYVLAPRSPSGKGMERLSVVLKGEYLGSDIYVVSLTAPVDSGSYGSHFYTVAYHDEKRYNYIGNSLRTASYAGGERTETPIQEWLRRYLNQVI